MLRRLSWKCAFLPLVAVVLYGLMFVASITLETLLTTNHDPYQRVVAFFNIDQGRE